MEQFIYHNLFETKGIEYIITIIFFALLVPFWLALSRNSTPKEQAQTAIGTITADILRIPQGLFYCPNHLWSHLEKSGHAKVGIDDFFQHVIGEIQISKFIDLNSRIEKGQTLFEIRHNEIILTLASPISGTIVGINPELQKNPRIINSDPYGTGWIYKIKPENWKNEIASCYFAEDATNWMETELIRLKDFISYSIDKYIPETGEAACLDNGELIDHTLTSMPSEIWNDFQREFLDKV
jgi:glycine cleavage system H protein